MERAAMEWKAHVAAERAKAAAVSTVFEQGQPESTEPAADSAQSEQAADANLQQQTLSTEQRSELRTAHIVRPAAAQTPATNDAPANSAELATAAASESAGQPA
eukprot:2882382-Prymnesium_polylepis.1